MPRRAPHFLFGKKMGGKEPRGALPLRTPFLRPAANLFLFRAAGRLNGPLGRKPPADGKTLEKPRSKAQLFKRFCAKEDACALWLISPFLSLLAGLTALWAANRRLTGETPEKPRSGAQLFGRFCAGGTFDPAFYIFMEIWRGLLPGKLPPGHREQEPGFSPAWENRSRARATRPKTAACVRDTGTKQTRGAICSPQVCSAQPRVNLAFATRYLRVLRARQNRQSSRNSLRGRADAPVPWKGPGDIRARPCVCR